MRSKKALTLILAILAAITIIASGALASDKIVTSPPSEGNISEVFPAAEAIKSLILGYEISYSEADAWRGKSDGELSDLADKVVESIQKTDPWIFSGVEDPYALVLDMMNTGSYMIRRRASAANNFQITPLSAK